MKYMDLSTPCNSTTAITWTHCCHFICSLRSAFYVYKNDFVKKFISVEKIWMAKNCKNHRFRSVFVTFLHYEFIMANITAVGHISNFIFCSLDMCPNSISYTKNYQNLSHGLCHPLLGFSMDSLLRAIMCHKFGQDILVWSL